MLRKGDEMTIEDLNVHDRWDRVYVEEIARGGSSEPELKFSTSVASPVEFDSVRPEIERGLQMGGVMTVKDVHTQEGRMDAILEVAGWKWQIEMDWFRHR
jgi:hypothetical protein